MAEVSRGDGLVHVGLGQAGAYRSADVVKRAAFDLGCLHRVVTTNPPFEQWTEVMGSERLTGALLDRLTHHIHILEANGESYRLKQSRGRLRRRTTPTSKPSLNQED